MRIIFMGTPDFAASVCDRIAGAGHTIVLCVTQPDRPRGRKKILMPPPVKTWALSHGVPVFQPEKIKSPDAVHFIRSVDADAAVVAAYGQILPEPVLHHPRFGCINVHASLLPKYRGAAPIQWAILNGDSETGVTTMQMGPGLDDGDILLQSRVVISPEETGGSLFDKLAAEGGRLAVETLSALSAGELHPTPQDEKKATRVGMIKKELGHLDFHKSAEELFRYVRGLDPWPGTYAYENKKLLKIRGAKPADASLADCLFSLQDGTCDKAQGKTDACGRLIASDGRLFVLCGENSALELTLVQPEGKKTMRAADYLRGHAPAADARLY